MDEKTRQEIIKLSDKIKKRNYRNRIMLKEADEHKDTQNNLLAYNRGINELLRELGIRKEAEKG